MHFCRGNYFTVGDQFNVTTDIKEAFRRSLQTVQDWALTNSPLYKSTYLFFRSYSPSHYGNRTWDTGGSCADHREPLTMTTGEGNQAKHSWINDMMSSMVQGVRRRQGMKRKAVYL